MFPYTINIYYPNYSRDYLWLVSWRRQVERVWSVPMCGNLESEGIRQLGDASTMTWGYHGTVQKKLVISSYCTWEHCKFSGFFADWDPNHPGLRRWGFGCSGWILLQTFWGQMMAAWTTKKVGNLFDNEKCVCVWDVKGLFWNLFWEKIVFDWQIRVLHGFAAYERMFMYVCIYIYTRFYNVLCIRMKYTVGNTMMNCWV